MDLLDPGVEWRSTNFNYRSMVAAINAQSEKGKLSFFKTLALNLNFQDRTILKELLELKNKKTYRE